MKKITFLISLAILLSLSLCQINDRNCKFISGYQGLGAFVPFGDFYIATSDDRFLSIADPDKYDTTNGKLLLIDYMNNKIKEIPIENMPTDFAFHPHGLSIFNDRTLFVINHAMKRGGERIEVFRIIGSGENISLRYETSFILGDDFNNLLYGIFAVDEDKFFLTQYLQNPGTLKEGLLNSRLSNSQTYAYFCNMKELSCNMLYDTQGIMITGIAFDSDNKKLYVSDTFGNAIKVLDVTYGRDFSNLKANYRRTIKLDFAPANLLLDSRNGKIYAGFFSKAQDLVEFARTIADTKSFPSNFNSSGGVFSLDLKTLKVDTLVLQSAYFFPATGFYRNNLVTMTSFFDEGVYTCSTN